MVLGLVLAAVAFYKMTEHTGGQLVEGLTYPAQWSNMYVHTLSVFQLGGSKPHRLSLWKRDLFYRMLGMMVLFIASYATGMGNIPWQGSELFPLELRGLGE